jgi:hypothetical protein
MSRIPFWKAKLVEAEFFHELMKQYFNTYEFQYFVSVFLSAIQSGVEHNRLHSQDDRFRDWYREVTTGLSLDPTWRMLRDLRNKEVHQKGTDAWQEVSVIFPDGIVTKSLELRWDLSGAKPVTSYKSEEMESFVTHPAQHRWVWKTDDEPDVLEACANGLNILRKVIQYRQEMSFSD